MIVGVYVPILVPRLVSLGLSIPDLVSDEFYVRFRLFGFSFVGAYLVEQLVLFYGSDRSRRRLFHAFVTRFGFADDPSPGDRFGAFVAGFVFALAVFALQVWFGRAAGILPSLAVVVCYLGLLHEGEIRVTPSVRRCTPR